MKLVYRWLRAVSLGILITTMSGLALADRGGHGGHRGHGHFRHHGNLHGGFGISIGPFWGPALYPWPVHERQVIVQSPPVVYVEQSSAGLMSPAPAAPAQDYWYYCAAAQAYYPYVRECPAGWMKVVPQGSGTGQ